MLLSSLKSEEFSEFSDGVLLGLSFDSKFSLFSSVSFISSSVFCSL